MKNINLAPSSLKPVKGVRRNKPFIFISLLFLLMFFSFFCFSRFSPLGKQWQDKFVAKVGSLFGNEKSNETTVGIEIKGNKTLIKADSKAVAGRVEEKPIFETADKKAAPVEIEKQPVLTQAESRKEGGDEEKIKRVESSAKTTSNYYIQICSCVIKDNAEKTFRRLANQGYSPVMKEIVGHVKMHNIYTDDFAKRYKAVELLDRLKKDGFDSVLFPSSNSRYKLRITSCFYMESAKKVIKSLNRLGYKASICKEFIPTKMYSVLLGNFDSLQEAESASHELIKHGYPKPILKHNP